MGRSDKDLIKAIESNTALETIPKLFIIVAGAFSTFICIYFSFRTNSLVLILIFLILIILTLSYYCFQQRVLLLEAKQKLKNHKQLSKQHENLVKEMTLIKEEAILKDMFIKFLTTQVISNNVESPETMNQVIKLFESQRRLK